MTDCNTNPIGFSSLGRRAVVVDFAGGTLTSDGGTLLLREADRRLRLTQRIDAVIPDPRNQFMIIHSQLSMLRQRIYAIAAGYEDLNDHQSLRVDPLMQLLCECKVQAHQQPLASPPTLHRLENRVMRRTLFDIAKVLVEAFIESYGSTAPTELILDFDASNDPVHGNQINRFFHGYYDQYCFLPLYVFCGHHLLAAYLRPANIDPARHAWVILALLVKRLRQVWPNVKIIFRADSGFCRWKMLRWCEKHGVFYMVGLARNSRLKELAQPFIQQAQDQFSATDTKQRVFGQIDYAAYTWDKQRRVIVKAEQLAQGPNLRFVVSNLQGQPQGLYDGLYCKRGDAENRIKEQQLGLFADRTSCHDFVANQFRVLLSAAAYVLVQHIREHGLRGSELADAQVTTLRTKLLKLGGRIVLSARRIVLHLASSCPLAELFRQAARRLLMPAPS